MFRIFIILKLSFPLNSIRNIDNCVFFIVKNVFILQYSGPKIEMNNFYNKLNNLDHQCDDLSKLKSKIYVHQDHQIRCILFKT